MYLDPGFGGMLLQVLVVIAATGGAILFSFRKKISALFSKDKSTESRETTRSTDDSEDDVIDTLSDDK